VKISERYRDATGVLHLLVPVAPSHALPAEELLRRLLDKGWWAFGPRSQGRVHLRRGDRLAFYLKGAGVAARALLADAPSERRAPGQYDATRYSWAARVGEVQYLSKVIKIDKMLRSQLDAFKGKDPSASGSWFVQSARMVTGHDYRLLTGQLVVRDP
jgi:hypothetical protein